MNRVYVAGKFEDTERVRGAQQKLRDLGFVITHDWTQEDATGLEGEARAAYLRKCAVKDYEGVLSADIIVVLNNPKCFGAMTELGLALAWGKVAYIAQPQLRENIFWHLPEEVGMRLFPTDHDAIQAAYQDLVGLPGENPEVPAAGLPEGFPLHESVEVVEAMRLEADGIHKPVMPSPEIATEPEHPGQAAGLVEDEDDGVWCGYSNHHKSCRCNGMGGDR